MKKLILSLMLLLPVLVAAQNQARPVQMSPVIAVTDMQVLYRDYDNRIKVAVPGGTNPSNIMIECREALVNKSDVYWIIRPNADARKCTIAVYTMVKGQKQLAGKEEFRVLPLPKPEVYFTYGEKSYENGASIPISILTNENSRIVADYSPGSLLRISYEVTQFKVVINGVALNCEGATFNRAVRDRISHLQSGSTILITGIKAKAADDQLVTMKPISLIVR